MSTNSRELQRNFFGEIVKTKMSLEDAARKAHVSVATVRNWIKTGYLEKQEKGFVTSESFNDFMQNVAGKEKLNKRANKTLKDSHEEAVVESILTNKDQSSWHDIAHEYEKALSDSYRNKEGIFYTPKEIIVDMFDGIEIQENTTFLDPCCGSGNFIIEAINQGVKPKNIYGYDVDPNAVEIARKRVKEKTGMDISENIQLLDFLESGNDLENKRKYDIIFTNPPWGKKLPKKIKEKYAEVYGSGASLDTSSLFYFASYQLLKEGGVLGFLVQEALFNISNYLDTRNHILQNKILRLIDYGKAFKGLLTRAHGFILEKNPSDHAQVSCQSNDVVFTRDQDSFSHNPKSIFNFWVDDEESKVLEHVLSKPFSSLKGNAKWGLGIVTGNNAKYCIKAREEGYVPVFKGSDITKNGLKEPTNFIPQDFTLYQQVAPIDLYQTKEKLIYKFISSQLVFFCDTEQRFILNSANLLIPSTSLEISGQQLADMLNSDFMNWFFTSVFRTHKILRGDLELLPLHLDYYKQYSLFDDRTYLDFLGLKKTDNGSYRLKE